MCCWPAWRCATARWCASATPNGTTSSADRRCGTGCRPGCCTRASSPSAVAPSAVVTSSGRNLAGWPLPKQASGPANPWRPCRGTCSDCRSPRTCCAKPPSGSAPRGRPPPTVHTAQQITALAERVAELTEQLTADPGQAQRARQRTGGEDEPGAARAKPVTAPGEYAPPPLSGRAPADAAKSGADRAAAASGPRPQPSPAGAGASPADSGAGAAGPDAPEASDDT